MKNFFKGLSFSQLFAGALAAITSFLLSSKIGIAGSVIGVAVASIVSTAASQIYKNVIDASSKKLQDAAHKLAQVVYSNTQAETSQPSGSGASNGGDDVVDADYEVVDDDKDNK